MVMLGDVTVMATFTKQCLL